MVRMDPINDAALLVPRLRPSSHLASPFGVDRKRPKLTLVVDPTTCESGEWLNLLLAFGEHDRLEMLSTDGHGRSLHLDDYGGGDEPVTFRIERGSAGTTFSAIHLPAQYKRFAVKAAARWAITADRAVAELLLAQAAKHHSHFLVTDSDFLLRDAPRGLVRDANPIAVRQALAIVGLYLRTEGEFLVEPRRDGRLYLSRGLFYRCLAWDLLPTAWRWFGACGESARCSGDETLLDLADATLDRTSRALRARDHVLAQVQLPATHDTQDEALFYLDAAHLFLKGAFDAAALMANVVYKLNGKPIQISWTDKDKWRKKLEAGAPELAELTAPNTRDRNVIDLTALVRNTIHRVPLRGVAYSTSGDTAPENLVVVPNVDKAKLLALVARLGGPAAWGIRDIDEWTCLEADTYVCSLVSAATRSLDAVLAAIDMERLTGVDVAVLAGRRSVRRAEGSELQLFSPELGLRLRLHAGLPLLSDGDTAIGSARR
jgi:hypothetical protein